MKLKIEDRQNEIHTAEMWARKPRWRRRRHYRGQKLRKYNLIAFKLLKMSPYDFWRMTVSHIINNITENFTLCDAMPHLHWHSSPSCITTETVINNVLNSGLLSPRLSKDEKTRRSEQIVIQKESLATIFNAKKNCQSNSSTLFTPSLDSKYLEFNSNLVSENDDNHDLLVDSTLNEALLHKTSLNLIQSLNHEVNVIIKEQTNTSLINSLTNITIYLMDTNTSRNSEAGNYCYSKLKEGNCEECENIFVYIEEGNFDTKKYSSHEKYLKRYRDISTSTSDISFCICNAKNTGKKSIPARYILSTCVVKDEVEIPRNENNPWNCVDEKITVEVQNKCTHSYDNLKEIKSESKMRIANEISLGHSESSETSLSTSLDDIQMSSMNLINTSKIYLKKSLLANSSIFSSSLMSIPALIPRKKKQTCTWRYRICPRTRNFTSNLS